MTDEAKYAETLMKHYAHRVLAYLKTLPMETLEIIGTASPAEANANYHEYFCKQIEQHGAN